MTLIVPRRHQRALPLERLILSSAPSPDALEMDVLFVGAGPAGLAGAIELATLARRAAGDQSPLEVNIGVLEKAGGLGEHNLSGAVVNPRAFRELFPDLKDQDFPFRQPVTGEAVYYLTGRKAVRIPTPPTMRNHGFYTASVSELVRWLGERAEGLGVNIFPGFPAEALLVEGQTVRGVRTTATGLDREGHPTGAYQAPTDILARVTVLTEGTRGTLGQAYREWQGIRSENPQIFALGVKEVWRVSRPLSHVIHTLGWPLPQDAFGGSFCYPLGPDLIALGLVVGLDYPEAGLDVHVLLQRLKEHPLFRDQLAGGELLEWGAKTIPEGGFYALPARRSGAGLLMAGDTVGFVDVPSLKGIHYAMQSGLFAARAAYQAIISDDASAESLATYERLVNASYIVEDLYRTRNMRLGFKDGFLPGAVRAGLMTLSRGRFPGGKIVMHEDAERPRQDRPVPAAAGFTPDGTLTFSKVDAVFKSGNATRDTIPSHLLVGTDISGAVADFYSHVCPAGVYERVGEELRINAPNCVDCKATDILGPRWTPREGGSGPKYRLM
ncbi:MAG TPA: electron-transfer flavoprotein:ubiquinone oxidoreductase [Gemmatimonadales bacterium]|nr:electron-transfer flavoprotein:ubiquinone oxidoreductase [Gemmatimonadales bacterium]